MQKHANSRKKKTREIFFEPLPAKAEEMLYYDKKDVVLPYSKTFPRLHYHDRYEIGICVGGEGLFCCEDRYGYVTKGDVVFIAPDQRHYSHSLHRDTPCDFRFVYLHPNAMLSALRAQVDLDQRRLLDIAREIPFVLRREEYPIACEQLTELAALCREEITGKTLLVSLRLTVFLLEACRWLSIGNKQESNPTDVARAPAAEAELIAEFLSIHYMEGHSSGELARLCHLSESQLRRQFNDAYGMPPMVYRNYLRAKIASELLLRTTLSVAEIAEQIGFSEPSDLYRAFQRFFKTSPSEYRKQRGF